MGFLTGATTVKAMQIVKDLFEGSARPGGLVPIALLEPRKLLYFRQLFQLSIVYTY